MDDTQLKSNPEGKTPAVSPGTYSPVTVCVNDTVGAIFLGALALISVIGWIQVEVRYRVLTNRIQATDENR